MTVLVLMSGSDAAFAHEGQAWPKNLVEVAGLPIAQHVLEAIRPLAERGEPVVCVVRHSENRRFHTADVIRLLIPSARVVEVPDVVPGAACSALLAIGTVDPEAPLLVVNGDQVLDEDLAAITDDFMTRSLDAGIVTFRAVHPRWSYVRLDASGEYVVEAAEKRPISDTATAGAYWFRRAADFYDAIQAMIRNDANVDGKFYVCPAYNQLVLRGHRIGIFPVPRDHYHSLATPEGAAAYERCKLEEAA